MNATQHLAAAAAKLADEKESAETRLALAARDLADAQARANRAEIAAGIAGENMRQTAADANEAAARTELKQKADVALIRNLRNRLAGARNTIRDILSHGANATTRRALCRAELRKPGAYDIAGEPT